MHKQAKILIADDDLEDLELIEEAFLNVQPAAQLFKFTNGKSAIEYLNTIQDVELPCLMVLDYNMPEINGSEMLSHLKSQARFSAIPKVVLSTSNAPLHIHECMSHGATDYLVKPDNIKELNLLAQRLLSLCA
jgi:CheY-like chemotaxis protein